MDVKILGNNVRFADGFEDYARKKLERLDRYLPNITDVRVEFARENTRRGDDIAKAQITVRHARGAILRAQESVNGELEMALNQALDKLYRQIRRFKGKRTRKGRERFSASIEELNVAEDIPAEFAVEAGELNAIEDDELVIRRKPVLVTAMSEEEAIEQMELLGHTFFVYYDHTRGQMQVLYKRDAGGYGVLMPDLE